VNFTHGRLRDPAEAPVAGEHVDTLGRLRHLVVEQILSGELDGPIDFRQDEDEWVVLLAGRATLEVDGEDLDLTPGDWVLLPAGIPHRLVETDPGTSWLAVTSATESAP
jgi:cupin 2 domain-containing protein